MPLCRPDLKLKADAAVPCAAAHTLSIKTTQDGTIEVYNGRVLGVRGSTRRPLPLKNRTSPYTGGGLPFRVSSHDIVRE